MPSQIELESHMKEKEVYLANRNLFYELQFALKSKRNEWNERERKAKRATDQTVDDNANLLENEILKYKSGLRRRRRTNNTSAECNSIATPADSSDMNELYSETNNSILAEFMMKRTKLFVEDDEVLYEWLNNKIFLNFLNFFFTWTVKISLMLKIKLLLKAT